jgi:hypothetical protein
MEQAVDPTTPPFVEWVKSAVHGQPANPNNRNDLDVILLSQTAM